MDEFEMFYPGVIGMLVFFMYMFVQVEQLKYIALGNKK